MKRWNWVIGLGAILAAGITLGLRPQPTPVETVYWLSVKMRGRDREEEKFRPAGGDFQGIGSIDPMG